jgi:hypothetical protein
MLKSKPWPLPTIPWTKCAILPKFVFDAKATRLFPGSGFNPECQSGIQTVSMDECGQQWVVVDDHEDFDKGLVDRLTALGVWNGES